MTKEKQLETIQNKINELYNLLDEYMQGATEEEKQAIPLYSYSTNKGLTSLLWNFNLVFADWIDRETFQNNFGVKPENIDDVINRLDDDLDLFTDVETIYEIIDEVETEKKGE